MASSRVADPPHQATVHDSSMNTDASAMQIKNHQLSSILDEFEQWATIVPNLSLDQRQEISEHLHEQISQLATFNEPNGTRKQQFIDLERLSKLQQGPLGKLVDYGGFLVIMDGVIRKRLQALSGKAVDVAPEVSRPAVEKSARGNTHAMAFRSRTRRILLGFLLPPQALAPGLERTLMATINS